MNIVTDVPPFKLKQNSIHDNSGWIRLMREIEVVLFCNDVDNVIIPKDFFADICRF